LERARILIADDNARSGEILTAMIERLGATVIAVTGGEEAILQLNHSPFDLLLVDAQMPGIDGFEVARNARRLVRPPVTVVMLGASAIHSDAAESRRIGIQHYVVKPVSEADLTATLQRALNVIVNDSRAATASLPQAGAPEGESLRVLLAEDNIVNQKLGMRLLEKMGHRVTLAADGEKAVRAHATGSFDVILMDVQMPEMNGLEATAQIREREKATNQHVAIIALTAHAIQGDRDRCLAAGMDDYLSKPIHPDTLAEKLENIARQRPLVHS
jgi:CheY-like chemotaxis protein